MVVTKDEPVTTTANGTKLATWGTSVENTREIVDDRKPMEAAAGIMFEIVAADFEIIVESDNQTEDKAFDMPSFVSGETMNLPN
jgi:hypothetical protein